MSLWPHQQSAIRQVWKLIQAGRQRIVVTSPTGGGKSRMMQHLIRENDARGGSSLLMTNRTMLFEQTLKGLSGAGIQAGARAAGYDPSPNLRVQVAMVQTEESRVHRTQRWLPHPANLVLIDEAHVNKGYSVQKQMDWYVDQGAAVVGFTATPLDLGGMYTELVVAGTNSELRECGAHVPCTTFAPDEPDCRGLKPQATGEFQEGEVIKRIMTPAVLDRVFDRWNAINSEHLPTIGFGPGVQESMWFAEQFHYRGVPSAHIDGENCWVNGQQHPTSPQLRDDIKGMLQDGKIKVIWNRFVLREGIDWPFVRVGIMATIFGSIASYLQSGGRIIRSAPGKESAILIDHGGNWWRHGSLNADREWKLGDTALQKSAEMAEALREGKSDEPIVCVECGAVRLKGDTCVSCGYRHTKRSRRVVELDGTIRLVEGKIFKPRKIRQTDDTQKHWEGCYWRAKKSGMTFRQAEALFFREHHYWPPKTLPNMPTNEVDWFRKVKDVPRENLIAKPKTPVLDLFH